MLVPQPFGEQKVEWRISNMLFPSENSSNLTFPNCSFPPDLQPGASMPSGNFTGKRNHSDPFGRNEEVAKLEITVLSLAFVAAVLGNASVLLAMYRTRRKPSRMHLFMKHLSLADLVVAFFQVLPQLCWEIHLQILRPGLPTLQQPTQRAHIMIGSTWFCSLVLSSPQYFIFSLSEVMPGSGVYDCWGHFVQPWGLRAYITWMAVGIFLLPVAVLVFCYGLICLTIWRNLKYKTRRSTSGSAPERMLGHSSVSSISTISRAKLRTVKMTFVIVLAYVVCWAPFFTVQILNSCCNPWIYMIFSGHLLSDFTRSFPCCRPLRRKLGHQDSDSSSRRTTLLSRLQGSRLSEPFRDLNTPPKNGPQVQSAS
ncbi:hypothetical protein F7725_022070 [Dissostichus mawsoni]|uniref:G-protein coupled receptors family 1 profile domain-containing protein n=1 Tax=Dissostichus mawsoni TaxID=36200 RepID=A0A7J5ZEU8_DISMA|nr:hypothetical protein F7725_022070 [Dissostichus mawsoni]